MKRLVPILLLTSALLHAQISSFPYKESFDSVATPNLPAGWSTTTNRNVSGDFTTSTTTVRSAPNCVSSTNGKISQSLISPVFDFTGKFVDSLFFYERRTSTHLSDLLVEASINGDTAFSIPISDTLRFINSTSYVKHSLALPETLNGKSAVRFRWRVLADTASGTTGVIRFDDISLTVKKGTDLSLTSISVSPNIPKKGDLVTITAEITNKALAGNFSGTVQLFDSLSLVDAQNFSQSFGVNESLAVVLNYPNIKAGRHSLTAKLILNADEDTTNNILTAVVNARYQSRTLLINEIMYAPPSGMPEWIECVNNSNDTIPISGWRISDAGTNKAVIQPTQACILPQAYFIVTTDTAALKDLYTISVPLFQSSFSALNNTTPDAVVLFDPTNGMIDSVMYHQSWGGTNGKSLERIDTGSISTEQSNWATSQHPLGATPGMINSVSKKEFDLSVERITLSSQFPVAGDDVTISTTIKNTGKQNATVFTYRLYRDANNDSIPSADEVHYEQQITQLSTNDSLIIASNLPSLQQGKHRLFSVVSFSQDNDTLNNTFAFSFTVGIPQQSIVITEIMYAPIGDEPEWIEFYNRSDNAIFLNGWKLSDAGTTKSVIVGSNSAIPSHSYFVVARDSSFTNYHAVSVPVFHSSFSALNNSTPDAVVLFDERGSIIDSVYYTPAWGGANGTTLQRFDIFSSSTDSANWKSALPSVGIENLIARKEYDASVQYTSAMTITNGTRIAATILNAGRQTANLVTVKFFHDTNDDSTAQQNELIHSSVVSSITANDSAIVQFDWNHALKGKQLVIVTAEFSQDQRTSNNTGFVSTTLNFASQSLVVNEIMYEPAIGHAEFVELLNRSSDSIDVAEWKLMDQPNTTGSRAVISLSQQKRIVLPNDFILVASDSSIVTQFPSLAGKFVVVNSSLSLSNNGEDVVLVDLTGKQIDSVRYSPSWHLKNVSTFGRSLERINPTSQTNDARNWSSSVAKTGASPLQRNSIFIASSSAVSGMTLTPNPFSPDNDGFEDFLSINYSLPTNSATIRVRIYDVTGRLIRRLAQNEPSPTNSSILWDGLDDDGHRVRIGMYIILFEAFDNFGGTVKTMKDVAVVAKKL